MKTTKFRKTLIAVLSALLLIGVAMGISVAAEDNVYDIKSINIVYGDTTTVLIAVDIPSDTELTDAPDVEVSYKLGGNDLDAEFHSYQYIAKYGKFYPVYYTVGIPAKDMGESVVAEAHKAGSEPAAPKYENVSVVEYLYGRLYKDNLISATYGNDLDRKDLYLALLNYGAKAQKVLWNNLPENKDDQRTLVTDYIYVYANGATVNGAESALLEKSAQVTLSGAPAVPAQYKMSGWQVTTYDKSGNPVATTPLDSNTYNATQTSVVSAMVEKANKTFEDNNASGMSSTKPSTVKITLEEEDGNTFYHVAKAADGSSEEYIDYYKNSQTYTDWNCKVYEANIRIDFDYVSSECSFNVFFGGWNGLNKFTIMTSKGSDVLQLSDWRSGVGGDTTLRSYDIGAKVGEWFTFRTEAFVDGTGNTVFAVYVNGYYIGKSTNAGVIDLNGTSFDTVTIKSNKYMTNGTYDLDDLYLGQGMMRTWEDSVIDFEDSTVAATGGKITASTATVTLGADSSVAIAENEGNKYLSFTANGSGNNVTMLPTGALANASDKFVFEADIKINSATVINFFGNYDNQRIYFYEDGANVRLNCGCDQSWPYTNIKFGDWFKLRIELDGTNLKVYGNETLIHETDSSDNSSKITKIQIYTFSNSKGDIYLDNIRAAFVTE